MNTDSAQTHLMRATPFEQTLGRRRANPGQAWPQRGPDCRLSPECWPMLTPSFSIASDAKIFAMGSCFARNIERHLHTIGFQVPSISILQESAQHSTFATGGFLNIFTPTAMRQELQWARAIFDRDDTVREADVLPLLVEVDPGRYVDVHLNPGVVTTTLLEDQIARRRLLYSINREAFLSDVVVFTLGYVEVWWSVKSQQSIQLHSKLQRLPDKSDFVFRRLRHGEAYDAVAEAIRLVQRDKPTKVMLTTSPVPITTTFTGDDVIIANTYSKSVLRAVAGDIAEDFEGVDYIPSYEAVMLTKSEHVWEDDLIHVSGAFVSKIMGFVASHYAKSADYTESNLIAAFRSAVHSADWATADLLFSEVMAFQKVGRLPLDGQALVLNYMKVRRTADDVAQQFAHILATLEEEPQLPATYFSFAVMAIRFGQKEIADRLRSKTASFFGSDPLTFGHLVGVARVRRWDDQIDWLLATAEPGLAGNPEGLLALARAHESRGHTEDARRLKAAALAQSDDAKAVWAYSVELEKAGDVAASIDLLIGFCKRNDASDLLQRLITLLRRETRVLEAQSLLEARLAAHPDDAEAHRLLAQIYALTQRTDA